MRRVYVVYGARGYLEDYETWPTKAFADLNRAEQYARSKEHNDFIQETPEYSPHYTVVPLEFDEELPC